ncbi:hypothetical protein SK128_023467, partial [Halocaridina rubra]
IGDCPRVPGLRHMEIHTCTTVSPYLFLQYYKSRRISKWGEANPTRSWTLLL